MVIESEKDRASNTMVFHSASRLGVGAPALY
jgi:hypothetical protein